MSMYAPVLRLRAPGLSSKVESAMLLYEVLEGRSLGIAAHQESV